jgi:transcriptional regulator with GAF, ATPase, and Fis domain
MTIHEQLLAAVDGRRGIDAADYLCRTCVALLDIDAAAISLTFDGAATGTVGASGTAARRLDELQFTFGEGPCLEAIHQRKPILVVEVADPDDRRWPAWRPAMLAQRIHAVYAMPVAVAGEYVGILNLFHGRPGHLKDDRLAAAVVAAEIAGIPLLDLLDADFQAAVADPNSNAWAELNVLSRTEVSQATGMLVAQLTIEPTEALVRIKAHAYATDRSVTDLARDILDGKLMFEAS